MKRAFVCPGIDEIDRLFEIEHRFSIADMLEFSQRLLLQEFDHRFADANHFGDLFVGHRIVCADPVAQADNDGFSVLSFIISFREVAEPLSRVET